MIRTETQYLRGTDLARQSVHLPSFVEMLGIISKSGQNGVIDLYFYTFGEKLQTAVKKGKKASMSDHKSLFLQKLRNSRKWADEEATLIFYKEGLLLILAASGGSENQYAITGKNLLLAYMYFDLVVRAPYYKFEDYLECAAKVVREYLKNEDNSRAKMNKIVEDFVSKAPSQARIYYK